MRHRNPSDHRPSRTRFLLRRARLALVLAVPTLPLLGCDDDPVNPGPPDPEPTYDGSTVTPSSANVNSLAVGVEATGYDAARLRLRTAGEPEDTTPPYPFVDGLADASALGLLAGRDYLIDVLLLDGSRIDSVETLPHTTGSLPSWVPDVGSMGEPSEGGFIGLAHPQGGIIVDGQGRVRWYLESPDPILNNFMAHPSGEYTIFGTEDEVRVYRVLDERGAIGRTIACVGRETRFHEIRVMPEGDYWALCDDEIPADLSAYGGAADGSILWSTLQHVDADGTVLFEFHTGDHFSLDDIDPSMIDGAEVLNMTHGNSIAFDSDGGVVFSSRSLDEVTKIDPTTGEVVWRLGGRANQFAIDDPTRAFARQHGVRVVAPGVLQLLDNGVTAPSRMIRYEVDEQAMTAELVLEYTHPSGAYTPVGGSTDVLPGGGGLASFGRAGRVVEVDAAGNETFELTGLEGEYIFRAFRIPSLYASERRTP